MKLEKIGQILCWVCSCVAAASLLIVVGFVVIKGAGYINWHFLFGSFNAETDETGRLIYTISSSIVTTLAVVFLSLLIAVPLGIATAIFLNEYTKKGNWLVRLVRSAIDILSGIPSIVYALFGMVTFVVWFGRHVSILAGSLTVTLMLLPTVIRSTEESLKSVSDGLREGSYALGAGKLRTIFVIILPSAMPGIISGVILGLGRVVGETMALVFTAGSVVNAALPSGLMQTGSTLTVYMYSLISEGNAYYGEAWAIAVVLILLTILINGAAELIGNKLKKEY